MPADLFFKLDPRWRRVLQVVSEVTEPPEVVALKARENSKTLAERRK
jgi:hypothetical protein